MADPLLWTVPCPAPHNGSSPLSPRDASAIKPKLSGHFQPSFSSTVSCDFLFGLHFSCALDHAKYYFFQLWSLQSELGVHQAQQPSHTAAECQPLPEPAQMVQWAAPSHSSTPPLAVLERMPPRRHSEGKSQDISLRLLL